MVDNVNPTSQFHPYVPERSEPQTGKSGLGGLGGILSKVGLDQAKIDAIMRGVSKARGMARNNGGLVLGGLAALVISAGLMRKRSMVR